MLLNVAGKVKAAVKQVYWQHRANIHAYMGAQVKHFMPVIVHFKKEKLEVLPSVMPLGFIMHGVLDNAAETAKWLV